MIGVLKSFLIAMVALFLCVTGVGVIGFMTTPMALLESVLFVYSVAFPMTSGAIAGEVIFLLGLTVALYYNLYGPD